LPETYLSSTQPFYILNASLQSFWWIFLDNRHIILQLIGDLTEEALSSAENQLKDWIQSGNIELIIDFTELVSWENHQISKIVEVAQTLKETGIQIAFVCPSLSLKTYLSSEISSIYTFSLLEEAKNFMVPESKPEIEESQIQTGVVTEYAIKDGIYYVHCPNCNSKLRVRNLGNHACPACKTKFFFKPSSGSGASPAYEVLSLE
jgi:anti-anti-sigma regulatory factor/DNA-directed RNA polymerase subunit RPC12/RpoP